MTVSFLNIFFLSFMILILKVCVHNMVFVCYANHQYCYKLDSAACIHVHKGEAGFRNTCFNSGANKFQPQKLDYTYTTLY